MKKHRHIIMFMFMLALMVMMATFATRNLERPALVEVVFPGEDGWLRAREDGAVLVFTEEPHGVPLFQFAIKNISDDELIYAKRYELWRILGDYEENVLFASIDGEETYLLSANETVIFVYGGGGNVPKDFGFELEQGTYVLAKIFTFHGGGLSHVINIAGHEFRIN